MTGTGTFLGWISILTVLRPFLVAPKSLKDEGQVTSCHTADFSEPFALPMTFPTHCSLTLLFLKNTPVASCLRSFACPFSCCSPSPPMGGDMECSYLYLPGLECELPEGRDVCLSSVPFGRPLPGP